MSVDNGAIVIRPSRPRYSLDELVGRIGAHRHAESEWERRSGTGVWPGYVPDAGDLVWQPFDPPGGMSSGVVDPRSSCHLARAKRAAAVAYPPSHAKYPFEVALTHTTGDRCRSCGTSRTWIGTLDASNLRNRSRRHSHGRS